MAKDVGTAIHKSIVVSFLPCLVAFLGFHPYMVPHFFKTVFCNFLVVTLRYHTKATSSFAFIILETCSCSSHVCKHSVMVVASTR